MCQREKFIELIEAEIKLQLVEIPHWAGLGGVCYIPPEQRRSPDDQGNLLMGIDSRAKYSREVILRPSTDFAVLKIH